MSKPSVQDAHRLTMAGEDYLEAIYRLTQENAADEGVRSVDVAEQLDVSKASVNKALSTLKDAGFVEQNRYGRVQLTDEGKKYGAHVWQCHRALRTFLMRDLGVSPEVADVEACQMEHALSHDTQKRWIDYLEQQGLDLD